MMIYPSTFSIVAYDPTENAWGIAVASKFPAVGSVVPWAQAGAGAVATQSHANTSFGPRGLDLMGKGATAQQTLVALIADDPHKDLRQVGLVDYQGGAATFTGSACHAWAGGLTGKGYAIQGNILAGEQVVRAIEASYVSQSGSLMRRLFQALLAGDRAGGDRRGRQSAAIYIVKTQCGYGGFNDRWIDYRVDDHTDPVPRLGELLDLHELYFGESPIEERVRLVGQPLILLQTLMQRLGYYQGESHGLYDPATRVALVSFIGNENFEERFDAENGVIDRPVLDFLHRRFGDT
jgi:uncharacterized Ntn-hydrolase superfamily protein